MNYYFSNLRLESEYCFARLCAFEMPQPYTHTVRLTFSEKPVSRGNALCERPDIVVSSEASGWIYSSPAVADDISLAVSENYDQFKIHGAQSLSQEEEDVVLYFLQTALECRLLLQDTLTLHAACLALPEGAVVFAAPSGTGKSTRARVWIERMHARLISGDRPVIALETPGTVAYGAPWDGKEQVLKQARAPVLAVCEIRRAPFLRVRRLNLSQASALLARQCFIPMWDEQTAARALVCIRKMAASVPVYRLFGGIDHETAEKARKAICGFSVDDNRRRGEDKDMRIRNGFVLRMVMDEHIVMPTGENINRFDGALVLSEVSAFLWKQLEQPICAEDLLELLLAEYDVDRETAAGDLNLFIQKLREYDLLEEA